MSANEYFVKIVGRGLAIRFDYVLEPVVQPVAQNQLATNSCKSIAQIGAVLLHLVDD